MKLIGALLLLLTGIGSGLLYSNRLIRRAAVLRSFERLCDRLSEEIRYTGKPIAALLASMADEEELAPLRSVLREITLDGDWRQAYRRGLDRLSGKGVYAQDLMLARSLSEGLGASDCAGQITHCRACAARFRSRADEAAVQAKAKGRLYVTLGAAGGLLAALIL